VRAPILDQPSIGVADGHEEEVDRHRGDDRPIWTVDIAYRKQSVDDRDIAFDEADAVVGERRCVVPLTACCASGPKSFTIATRPCRKSPCGVTKVPSSANMDARSSAFF
jgi:hypothetical protein